MKADCWITNIWLLFRSEIVQGLVIAVGFIIAFVHGRTRFGRRDQLMNLLDIPPRWCIILFVLFSSSSSSASSSFSTIGLRFVHVPLQLLQAVEQTIEAFRQLQRAVLQSPLNQNVIQGFKQTQSNVQWFYHKCQTYQFSSKRVINKKNNLLENFGIPLPRRQISG